MNNTILSSFKKIFTIFLALFLVFGFWWGGFFLPTYAVQTEYSDVLSDLENDSSFDWNLYPNKSDDYSLQVITLAESDQDELFIYVYQPSGQAKNLRASSINLSTNREAFSVHPSSDEDEESTVFFMNYSLRYIDSDGVFFKYAVNGFTVPTASQRYYGITQILRPFDKNIDQQASDGNTITEVEYSVEKQFCFGLLDGEPHVEVVDIETIEITDKFVGYVRYMDGFQLYVGACDSHFVAFNTDRDIDKLVEADVYYTSQDYSWTFSPLSGERSFFGTKTDKTAFLTSEQHVDHTGSGWFAGSYSWDRIETVEQFIDENEGWQNVYSGVIFDVNIGSEITEEGKAALQGKKWVLRFVETDYSLISDADTALHSFSTLVGDVMILRLKFETDGVTYNLGVIDNKQTGSDIPVNSEHFYVELNDLGKWILAIIALIVLFVVFGPILPYIIKAVVWVIMLPFKAIAAIVKGIQKAARKKPKDTGQSSPKVQPPQPKTVKQRKSAETPKEKSN